jgi:hypothetical protein
MRRLQWNTTKEIVSEWRREREREREREIKRVCNGARAKLDQNACREDRELLFLVETGTTTREAQAVLLKEGLGDLETLTAPSVV